MTSRLWKFAPVALALLVTPLAHRAGAQATCKDGTTSAAKGRGACSGHGGVAPVAPVAPAAKRAAVRSAKADVRAAKTAAATAKDQVTCTDGSMSAGGRGACSGHGGIDRGATKAAHAEAKADVKAAKAERREAVHTPVGTGAAEDNNPAGAIAKCKDGLYSHARSRRGACGHHGGVATWM
ncbi:MAG: DUF3761 domain-containing protein [Gemmatimonadaceae bacterium]